MTAAWLGPDAVPPAGAVGVLEKAWILVGFWGRVGLVGLVALLVIWGVAKGLRRLGRAGRRHLLLGLTGLSLIGTVALGVWAARLPDPGGSYFVFWHQIVRVGAALSSTGFVVGFMSLALPWLLDRIERRGFVSFVAARHVRASKSGFLTVISVLSIAGVGVSAFALCAVVSIMGGFGADLKRKILGNNAHIRIDADQSGGFSGWDATLDAVRLGSGVAAATPVAGGEAMASSTSNTAGVLVRGIDADTIGTVIELLDNIEVGRFEYLTDPVRLNELPDGEPIGIGRSGERYLKSPRLKSFTRDDLDDDVADAMKGPEVFPAIIIGRELAKSLHVYVGDEMRLVSPIGDLGPMGLMPKTRQFRVAAVFYSGMYEYDASHAYMIIDEAQELLDLGGKITAIDVKVDDAEAVTAVTLGLAEQMGRSDLRIRDWKEMNKSLFSALKLEKIATFIVLSLAIAVASFCIICTLLLMVTEKSKEIAILKAVGASNTSILRIFMTEGLIIGGIGTVFGVVTGLVACLGLLWFGVRLDPEVYYVDRLPIEVNGIDYFFVALSAMFITMLATVYPALAASRLRPVDGIRYE